MLSVLLYGAESWKVTKDIYTKCLRKILGIFWPNKISNEDLLKRTTMTSISKIIKIKRWRWMGHICRMQESAIPRKALRWTPQGSRKRGRPMETWRRTMEREMKEWGWTLGEVNKLAQDRDHWRSLLSTLCVDETHQRIN